MKRLSFHALIIFVLLSAFIAVGLIFTPETNAQHQGHQMPKPKPTASPAASPKTETKMPGMPMPTASPSPQASPQHQMHADACCKPIG